MARNLRKLEFWTESSGLGTFFARKEETVLEAKTRALNALDTDFYKIKECLELLVNFVNKILIHNNFKTIIC